MASSVLRVMAAITTALTLTIFAPAPAYADDPAVISGVVYSGVPGATVTDGCVTVFQAEAPIEVATDCLDSDQHFRIPVEPGRYKVRVQATGFPEQWYSGKSTFERATPLEITTYGSVIYVRLSGGFADIVGRVVRSDGTPVQYGDVTAYDVAGDFYLTDGLDLNGEYELKDLPVGRYQVSIYANSYGRQWAFGTQDREQAAVFDLSNGEVRVVNDTLLPTGTVEVTMVDAESEDPIRYGCVRLTNPTNVEETCESVGRTFVLDDVPPGDYEVQAGPEGTHWPDTTSLTVEPGQTHRLTIPVERATAFVTTVEEAATGLPAAGVCVQFAEPNLSPAWFFEGCSREDGRLVIGPLEGRVHTQLFALHPQNRYGAQWVGANGGTGDQREAVFFTAENDTATTIPPLKVDPPGSITGVVRDKATGNPMSQVCAFPFALSSTTALDRQSGSHCSDSTGRFTINGLGPYDWPVLHIAVFRTQYAWLWSGGASDRFAARYVPVQAGQSTEANIEMVEGGRISGRGLTSAGQPATSHSIVAHNARTGDLATLWTNGSAWNDGRYELRGLATQDVTIEYFISGRTCWYDRALSRHEATPVHVEAGATTTGIDLVNCSD